MLESAIVNVVLIRGEINSGFQLLISILSNSQLEKIIKKTKEVIIKSNDFNIYLLCKDENLILKYVILNNYD